MIILKSITSYELKDKLSLVQYNLSYSVLKFIYTKSLINFWWEKKEPSCHTYLWGTHKFYLGEA